MCIDLNMRMQSVLVRPYILDCLCEHNQLTTSQTENFKDKLYGNTQDQSIPEDDSVEIEYDVKTNFEADQRRKSNPFKKMFKKKKKKDGQSTEGGSLSNSQIESSTGKSETAPVPPRTPKGPVGIISQSCSPGVRELQSETG
jgi:hypothetical protein